MDAVRALLRGGADPNQRKFDTGGTGEWPAARLSALGWLTWATLFFFALLLFFSLCCTFVGVSPWYSMQRCWSRACTALTIAFAFCSNTALKSIWAA